MIDRKIISQNVFGFCGNLFVVIMKNQRGDSHKKHCFNIYFVKYALCLTVAVM